jgi:hypothetical protein
MPTPLLGDAGVLVGSGWITPGVVAEDASGSIVEFGCSGTA